MAKKKEIKLTRTAGETVESGDVNFSYNNVLIGSLSDSGSAVLKTENTVVKHDIEVEYTKPATGITLAEVNITNTARADISASRGSLVSKINGVIVNGYNPSVEKVYIIPLFDARERTYDFTILVESMSDNLNVTLNSVPVEFSNDGYYCADASSTYPEEITIVITNKE